MSVNRFRKTILGIMWTFFILNFINDDVSSNEKKNCSRIVVLRPILAINSRFKSIVSDLMWTLMWSTYYFELKVETKWMKIWLNSIWSGVRDALLKCLVLTANVVSIEIQLVFRLKLIEVVFVHFGYLLDGSNWCDSSNTWEKKANRN